MVPRLFDLHCDTAVRLYAKKQSIVKNPFHISLEAASVFPSYLQIMAVWSDKTLNDEEAWQRFLAVTDYLQDDTQKNGFPLLTDGKNLPPRGHFLAVEDARLLGGVSGRIGILYERGVRFLTLVWGGESRIGGAHDTNAGLTDYGRRILYECLALGIIPDISHASRKTANEVLSLAAKAGKPVIATHSNAFAICPHTRNLTDEQFLAIRQSGGIVGLCLCPSHLCTEPKNASVENVLHHLDHWLSLGGEDTVALGCDLDGTDLPNGFSDISDLARLAETMSGHGYTDTQIKKIFWLNAVNFVKNHI